MQIAPVNNGYNTSFMADKKYTAALESPKTVIIEHPNVKPKDLPEGLSGLRALNGTGHCHIKTLSIDDLATYVERMVTPDFEDKILEYHKNVLTAYDEYQKWSDKHQKYKHPHCSPFSYVDSEGRKYSLQENPDGICIKQTYNGMPISNHRHYLGYPEGKLPNAYHQKAFVAPVTEKSGNTNETGFDYTFYDYNIDDNHGYTKAVVSKNGNIQKISTAFDSWAPLKTTYFYKDGRLKKARVEAVYHNTYKGKSAICIFDDDRKIQKIYYDPKKDNNGRLIENNVYVRDEDGNFVLL